MKKIFGGDVYSIELQSKNFLPVFLFLKFVNFTWIFGILFLCRGANVPVLKILNRA